jgi:cell division protein FtsB
VVCPDASRVTPRRDTETPRRWTGLAYDETNRRAQLETDYMALSERVAQLHEAIETLKSPDTLRPDAAARLARYETNEARLAWERQKIEREIDDLLLEESERQMCEF